MNNNFDILILAADRDFYQGKCESLTVPTIDGIVGIMANHSNMIAAITPGVLTYIPPGEEEIIAAVSRGLVKVEKNQVMVLVDTIELPDEIDVNRAKRAEEQAREDLLKQRSREEYMRAQAEISRAIIRLRVKNSKPKRY